VLAAKQILRMALISDGAYERTVVQEGVELELLMLESKERDMR
jgi:hypothetical protein